MSPRKDYYRILQVDPSADPAVIEAAYKKLAYKYHPDVNDSTEAGEKMRQINEAWSTLSDPESRKKYDRYYFGRRGPQPADPSGSGDAPVNYPAPQWLKRLWMILGVTGLLFLLRLNPRLALIVGGGWVISAVARLLLKRYRPPTR